MNQPIQDRPVLDFWFEFASTYSYLAAMRIGTLTDARNVTVRWRPFLLGPIFKELGWDTSPFNLQPAKGRYMWRDMERSCATLGLPFRRPHPFPQQTVLAARTALVGCEQGWGEAFARAAYVAEFGEGRDIGSRETVGAILHTLDLDPAPVLELAHSNLIKTLLRRQVEEARQRGIFGAPSFVTPDGELFWGNDRLEAALSWIESHQDRTAS